MRGEVEIRCGDKVLLKESNLIVDGAGSLFADIMTAPRWCEDITEVSSILDASNYTIQAISFGKHKDGYLKNAHEVLKQKTQYFISNPDPVIVTTKDQSDVNDATTSSIIWGVSSLPEAPNPIHSKLNLDCYCPSAFDVEIVRYNNNTNPPTFEKKDGSFTYFKLAKNEPYLPDFGQNLNLIPSSIHSQVTDISSFSLGVAVGYTSPNSAGGLNDPVLFTAYDNINSLLGCTLGCWPEGQSQGGTPFFVFSSIDDHDFDGSASIDSTATAYIHDTNLNFSSGVYDASTGFYAQSGTLNGYFNEASSMDYEGYCTMVTGTDSTQGLTLSTNADYADTGEIIYQVTMASGDAIAAQLYGGIFNFGLWAIDINESLKAGNQPPLQFDVINNQRKYKLFARKDLSRSFTLLQDTYDSVGGTHYPATLASAPEVTITWKIYFL